MAGEQELVVGNDGEGIYLTGMANGYWSISLEEYLMTKKASGQFIRTYRCKTIAGKCGEFLEK